MCTVVSSNVSVISSNQFLFKYTLLGLWIVFISLLLYEVVLSRFLDLHFYDPVFSIYSFADWYEIMVIFCIYHLTWIANWNMYCFLLCSVFCINSVLCSIKLCVIKKSVFFKYSSWIANYPRFILLKVYPLPCSGQSTPVYCVISYGHIVLQIGWKFNLIFCRLCLILHNPVARP